MRALCAKCSAFNNLFLLRPLECDTERIFPAKPNKNQGHSVSPLQQIAF